MVRFISDKSNANRSADGPRMRVIGAGLSRSATSSLQAALQSDVFGFSSCMHMEHIAPHVAREQIINNPMLEDDKHLRQKTLHQIFDGYEATTDFPGWWFVDDLMDMYPDSVEATLGFFRSWSYRLICFPYKTDRLHWTIHQTATDQWATKWGVDHSPEFYDVYQEFVIKEAAKRGRKVLEWKAEDGWEPLCEFLGREAPKDKPFPWVNDAATMTLLKRILVARGLLTWATIFGTVYAGWTYWPGIIASASNVKNML